QAAICVTCTEAICAHCCSRRSNVGDRRRWDFRMFASMRNAVASMSHRPIGGCAEAGDERQADKSLFPDQTYFHALAVRKNAQDGDHSRIAEVCRFQGVPCLVEQVVSLQADEFHVRKQWHAIVTGKLEQDLVDLVSVLIGSGRFGSTSRAHT